MRSVAAAFVTLGAPQSARSRRRQRLLRRALCKAAIGLTSLSAAGCAVGPNFAPPTPHVADRWIAQGDGGEMSAAVDATRWWSRLHDPALTRLIEQGAANSPTVALAGEHIAQSRAQLEAAIGEIYPQQQDVSGGLSEVQQSRHAATYLPGAPTRLGVDQIALTANWELDFWGKYRRAVEAERATLAANRYAYGAALVALGAQIANAYVTVRVDEAQLAVARRNIASQQEGLRIAEARFDVGEKSELDLRQARSQVSETESQVFNIETSIRQAKDALAVLVGIAPSEIDAQIGPPADIPAIDPQISVGIPRDLLRRRPDILEAEQAAAAQSAQIGVARAQLYPSFSLGGQFGFSASSLPGSQLGDLFQWDSRAAQIGPAFTFPLFNYGRLQAAVRVQDALFRQAVINYQLLVLQAQQQVEDARAALASALQSTTKLDVSVTAARRGTQLAIDQYKEGEVDYTTVLNAQQSQLRVENELAAARGAAPLAAIALYQALGGGWSDQTQRLNNTRSRTP